ncbi:MAG: hypothetical protein ACYC1C_18040 [Chloroflexota bacterium]
MLRQGQMRWQNHRQLSDGDLRFVVETVATQRSDHEHVIDLLRDKPDIIDRMLEDDNLFRRVMGDEDALLRVSPWLLFTVLVRRAAREMAGAKFTIERFGATERIPVFDGERVVSLIREPSVRDYLAEVLASFVRTDSTTVYYKYRRHYRRRTFSDIDVDDMIALAGGVAEEFRFPFYRRIGDICLFIAGVFPEHVPSDYGAGSAIRVPTRRVGRRQRVLTDYEVEARRFYDLAAAHPAAGEAGLEYVLKTLAGNFALAVKPLNFITDRYIRLHKAKLFGQAN